jgi:hypothetical protein
MRGITLVAGALALLAAGCQDCVGCVDTIRVNLPANTLVQGKPYSFQLCLDATCTGGLISPIKKGAICTGEILCSPDVGTPSAITLFFTDKTFLSGATTRTVTFVLTADAQILAQKAGTVTIETPPQGGDCAPCRHGTLNVP